MAFQVPALDFGAFRRFGAFACGKDLESLVHSNGFTSRRPNNLHALKGLGFLGLGLSAGPTNPKALKLSNPMLVLFLERNLSDGRKEA